jgi:hypothetical protein
MTEAVLQAINNLDVPDITFTGGYMKNNKLYVDQDSMNIYFEPVESENSLIFQIDNLTLYFASKKFSYSLLTVPLTGNLQANMSGTLLKAKVAF